MEDPAVLATLRISITHLNGSKVLWTHPEFDAFLVGLGVGLQASGRDLIHRTQIGTL